MHRDPLLLEQLSLQGAPLQLLQLHQGHPRHPRAGDEPGRHGSRPGRDGEVHLLHAADQPGEDRCAARWPRAQGRRRQDGLPASLPGPGHRVRRYTRLLEPGRRDEGRSSQLRAARGAEHEAPDDLSDQGAQPQPGPRRDGRGRLHDRPASAKATAGKPPARGDGPHRCHSPGGLRARLHVEPPAHPPQSEHGQPAEGASADGQHVLLRRAVHAPAGARNGGDRRAERGHGLLHGQGRRRAVRRDDPACRGRRDPGAGPAAVCDLLPAVPRRSRGRPGHSVPARQRPDGHVPPGQDPELPGRADLRRHHERRRADARVPLADPTGGPVGDRRPRARAPARPAGPSRQCAAAAAPAPAATPASATAPAPPPAGNR